MLMNDFESIFLRRMNNWLAARRIYDREKNLHSGHLIFENEIRIVLDSGEELSSREMDYFTFEMDKELVIDRDGLTKVIPLKSHVRIKIAPLLIVKRRFSVDAIEDRLDIYPSSTHSFYGRLIRGRNKAIYIVQNLTDTSGYWLTIISDDYSRIISSHKIKRYEYDVIRLKSFFEVFEEYIATFTPDFPNAITNTIEDAINYELSWAEISDVSEGAIPPTFIKSSSAEGDLCQLFSIEKYLRETRNQIVSFLVWVAKEKYPEMDIVDFLESIRGLFLFRSLFMSHLRFILDTQNNPPYLQIMQNVTTGNALDSLWIMLDEGMKENPSVILRRKIDSLSPDWQNELVDLIIDLEKSDKILTVLPVPKSEVRDRVNQRRRLLMYGMDLRLRAHVQNRSLGLRELVYIGAAHRWPHWHLAYSLRIDTDEQKTRYIQGMIMPNSSAEQVKRLLPSVLDVEWSSHIFNYRLYNRKKKEWNIDYEPIITSFSKSVNLRKLMNDFEYQERSSPYELDKVEAKILDMATTMFYLNDLESEIGRKYWQTNASESQKILENLRSEGVIDISYWYDLKNTLLPVYTSFSGDASKICSITKSLTKNLPTTLTRLANGGKYSLILARIPPQEEIGFKTLLTNMCIENSIQFEYTKLTTHRNYTPDLYQRLLNPDRTWNDDISGFLSQIRSIPKSLLEEIQEESVSN